MYENVCLFYSGDVTVIHITRGGRNSNYYYPTKASRRRIAEVVNDGSYDIVARSYGWEAYKKVESSDRCDG